MSHSLEHYFDELLTDPETSESSPPHVPADNASEPKATNEESSAHKEPSAREQTPALEEPVAQAPRSSNPIPERTPAVPRETSRPSNASEYALGSESFSLSLPAKSEPLKRPSVSEPTHEDALILEKKAQLQKLLSQQALFAKEKLEPELPAPVTETELKIEPPVESPKLDETALEAPVLDEPALETATYDSFHRNLKEMAQWAENGRPVWAQDKFEALLFEVSGLTLAVPLVSLGQIFPLTKELTPIFGQSDWMMGLLPSTLGRLRVVNTALFVMPEKYDEHFPENAKYVVSIDGVPWALAVDCVNQPITLDPDEIRWRSDRGKRAWLAGTVKSAMCALLDIPQMAQILAASDKNS